MTNLTIENKNRHYFFTLSLFLMSILLHQSNVILGINISFSDLFCFVLFIYMMLQRHLSIPIIPFLFFILVSIFVLSAAVFFVPFKFMYYPEPSGMINDYIKLAAILLYFIVGYNLMKLSKMARVIKWYSVFGLVIGGLGIFLTVFNINVFSSALFYADIRYRGLMNDPNYYSVLQITALVYFSRVKKMKVSYRYLALGVTLAAVLAAGSKTGMITLLCYLIFRLIEYTFHSKKKIRVIISQLFLLAGMLLIVLISYHTLQNAVKDIASGIPSLERVLYLFTDFHSAITSNGSERDAAWNGAFQIIQHSPIIGVGIGTYTNVVWEVFQVTDIAHNTFLQLTAEWGIPLAFIFFFYVIYLFVKSANAQMINKESNDMIRDILLVLLVGSMAISLNNARILWLLLGALASSVSIGSKSNLKEVVLRRGLNR
ncbi:O-antigen ligase family protein [Cytobacillus massiliigabonensis]|uniref:O-antigen ligase family protein n=1 Tax=Cytobacillus massiliigabonensis TaxID=1871011 RepID=UPI000C83FC45|nr:O-antigen ligase family protein [Cytobacillus massiliigabonensis]